jgi:hypothetical protein
LSVEASSSQKQILNDEDHTEKLLPPKASIDFDDDEVAVEVDDLVNATKI